MWTTPWSHRVYFAVMTCAYYIEYCYELLWEFLESPGSWHKYTEVGPLSDAIYGNIVLCVDNSTGDAVAIKRAKAVNCKFRRPVSKALHHMVAVYEDIEMERTILRDLNHVHGGHPHILKLRDDFLSNGYHNFVLEYCPHGDLMDLLLAQKRFSVDQAHRFLRQVASAVHFMHTCGYAHRDLSFENVFVDAKDECKLGDFGLAIGLQARPRYPAGKPRYTAPEVYLGQPYAPGQVDVWALEKAVSTNSKFQLLAQCGVKHVIATNSTWRALVPPMCVDLLGRMLILEPQNRIDMGAVMIHPFVATDPPQ
ncbi:CAMK/CAMKL protein kinase, variant [Aphanomyces invadans]|uniref:CAMK/CAMKL protein kinase, variant n=1 Tax=Aphanomyces invadans TaxID=157072 RepID=A0A024TZF9_9STRA|nr:CAMK/CAMKL protein kinase, variant [Aphanomyces invadans]ETV99021.1 CAMK/CAMKL protein kinase, variant [Aphanomyces invadans]|eukprot:XP_008872448.1 CAMK/CAMKL protein kinase, variant [Aphanomyces invadans]